MVGIRVYRKNHTKLTHTLCSSTEVGNYSNHSALNG